MKTDRARRYFVVGLAALFAGCGVSDRITGLHQGLHFFVVNDRLMVRGKVIGRTPASFQEVLSQNPQVLTVVFQDLRGTHEAAAARQIGYDLRKRGLATALQSDSAVHGAAAELFLSGIQRTMVSGAEIGLSAASSGVQQKQYLNDMLGSDRLFDFALRMAPLDGIYSMTDDDITQNGVLTAPIERLN